MIILIINNSLTNSLRFSLRLYEWQIKSKVPLFCILRRFAELTPHYVEERTRSATNSALNKQDVRTAFVSTLHHQDVAQRRTMMLSSARPKRRKREMRDRRRRHLSLSVTRPGHQWVVFSSRGKRDTLFFFFSDLRFALFFRNSLFLFSFIHLLHQLIHKLLYPTHSLTHSLSSPLSSLNNDCIRSTGIAFSSRKEGKLINVLVRGAEQIRGSGGPLHPGSESVQAVEAMQVFFFFVNSFSFHQLTTSF